MINSSLVSSHNSLKVICDSPARVGSRPCDPDDIVKALDTLYRRRRVDRLHARILRTWGERQARPDPAETSERCAWRL